MGLGGEAPFMLFETAVLLFMGQNQKLFFVRGCAKLAAPSKIVPFRPNRLYYLGLRGEGGFCDGVLARF